MKQNKNQVTCKSAPPPQLIYYSQQFSQFRENKWYYNKTLDVFTATHVIFVSYLQIKWWPVYGMEEGKLQNDKINTKRQFCEAVGISSTQALSVPQERKKTFSLLGPIAAGKKCMSQILTGSKCPQRVNSVTQRVPLNESGDRNIFIFLILLSELVGCC